jgi:hypothetical protein
VRATTSRPKLVASSDGRGVVELALLLDGELALAEPKKLRYRLLHVAARITRSARRTRLRINEHWPWAKHLATAFDRLAALPRPLTC